MEEEHISFHSDSLMVDGVEDYSHQIAEMVGLRNDSNFIEAGVSPPTWFSSFAERFSAF